MRICVRDSNDLTIVSAFQLELNSKFVFFWPLERLYELFLCSVNLDKSQERKAKENISPSDFGSVFNLIE